MKNTDFFKHKKVTVVGLGRSGLACTNLLSSLGAQVSITDSHDNELTRLNLSQLKSKKIPAELGRHTPEFIEKRDLIIVSPGVSNTSPAIIMAEELNIPIISEIEFASILCPATVIAVTGSNGKTTVTTLIGKVLEKAGKKVCICGNIGNPFSGELEKIKAGDFVSLELSSFQLERVKSFRPKIALILNFSCNHLDRYSDIQEYLEAKKRIFLNQDESDYLVLNYEDAILKGLNREARSQVKYFYEEKNFNPNQAAVLVVASILGVDKNLVLETFREFRGLEHRLEHVREINKVKFINDSKSTTVDSALWALKNTTSPIVLIVGGREKGNDYSPIRDLAQQKVKEIVLIGEARQKIRQAFGDILPIEEAQTLEEAVRRAFAKALPGDSVLLSPMCKSFDMFANFEERGRVFREAVCELTADKS